MRISLVLGLLGRLLLIIGGSMFFALGWAVYYGDGDARALLFSIIITMGSGAVLSIGFRSKETIRNRESFAVVTFGWIVVSFFGAMPYLFSGTFVTLTDAFFETISGFTTTGASVLTDIESVPRGILFWRSMTHWLGGMGIMVLFVALLSQMGGGGLQVFKAESPGPVAERIKPRIQETAKILWLTYVIISLVEAVLLILGGMTLFDSLCHTFGTMATGGFSTKNLSIGFYHSPYIQWVITIFMFLSGANFALYYQAIFRRTNSFWHNEEFRFYTYITFTAVFLIFIDLYYGSSRGIEKTLRDASFQVVSVLTTTGYATTDFDQWPFLSRVVLFVLMFIGGCAGSTGGSIKVGRILIMLKNAFVEISRLIHPRAVRYIKIDHKTVNDSVVANVLQFFFLYICAFFIGTVIMSFLGLGFTEALSSVAATLGNVGPGLGSVGPASNYYSIPAAGKWILSFFMLLGRLEVYTVLVLLIPGVWKK